jgi:hypothetical protein
MPQGIPLPLGAEGMEEEAVEKGMERSPAQADGGGGEQLGYAAGREKEGLPVRSDRGGLLQRGEGQSGAGGIQMGEEAE